MNKNRLLLAVMVGVTVFALSPTVQGPAPAGAEELKLAHFTSPRHPMDRKIFTPWGKELKV